LICSLEKSEQDAHNYVNAKTLANNIKLRSCPPVNEAQDTSTSDNNQLFLVMTNVYDIMFYGKLRFVIILIGTEAFSLS
jgi:hypothetical protein